MNANEKVLAGNADARYPDADNNVLSLDTSIC